MPFTTDERKCAWLRAAIVGKQVLVRRESSATSTEKPALSLEFSWSDSCKPKLKSSKTYHVLFPA